jgi:putative endonuclease
MDKAFYVYILASARYGTLYLGVTSHLIKRVWEHREGFVDGFTKEHGIKQMVWLETHTDAISAITRESRSRNGIGRGR